MPNWPHAPAHHFTHGNTFFITAGTHHKQDFYRDGTARDELQEILFATAEHHTCWLQAWCLLSNHYHLVVRADGGDIRRMLSYFHSAAAIALNKREGVSGRKVWYQFWDKTLTFEASWLARLRYTNENAVHHGVAPNAMGYRWCSARSFVETAPEPLRKTVERMKTDRVKVYDAF